MSTVNTKTDAPSSPPTMDSSGERMQASVVGQGPPLVLVGGGLTGWRSWEPHAERLADSRTVARLQLLAVQRGLEDRPLPKDYSVKAESAALARAVDHLGWDGPVDIAAWSYGALVTLDFALDHPDRIRHLILIEPPAVWTLPDGTADPEAGALVEVGRAAHEEVTDAVLADFLRGAGLCPEGTDPRELPQWPVWWEHRRSLRAVSAPMSHEDAPARLRGFDRPVLLVTGTGTSRVLRRAHDALATHLPRVRTLELPGGHAPHIVGFERFLEETDAFLSMRTVTSKDGTPIAVWSGGDGPPLLLVHGTSADHSTTWHPVLSELQRAHRVYAMDRRGRGLSGDSPAYDLRHEWEDVAAVVDALAESEGEPVCVLGHSYGGMCALEGALLTPNIRRLVIYEGVRRRGADEIPPGMVDRLQALLDEGDAEGILLALMRDLVGMPPHEIDVIRGQREAWATRLRNAPSIPREIRALEGYVHEPERFRKLDTPTILLVGEESPRLEHDDAQAVAEVLPAARVEILRGERHAAMHTSPDLFVQTVLRLLRE